MANLSHDELLSRINDNRTEHKGAKDYVNKQHRKALADIVTKLPAEHRKYLTMDSREFLDFKKSSTLPKAELDKIVSYRSDYINLHNSHIANYDKLVDAEHKAALNRKRNAEIELKNRTPEAMQRKVDASNAEHQAKLDAENKHKADIKAAAEHQAKLVEEHKQAATASQDDLLKKAAAAGDKLDNSVKNPQSSLHFDPPKAHGASDTFFSKHSGKIGAGVGTAVVAVPLAAYWMNRKKRHAEREQAKHGLRPAKKK